MQTKVKRFILENELFDKYDKLVVGLSGGADSVALLNVLISLNYECVAAHCNFHLRGDESDADEQFVKEWCQSRNINLVTIDFDTIQYAEANKISIEMAARNLRYEWFEKVRQQHKAKYIAVAHHQNDSIETFFINLVRGTGISGLSGIAPKNGNIVRPLLSVNRDEIEKYLYDNSISYRTDSTNLEDIFTRNYIRLNILPSLQKINPSAYDAIMKTIQNMAEVEKVYDKAIHADIKKVQQDEVINIPELKTVASSKSVLFEILYPLGFTSSDIEDINNSFDATSGKVFYSNTHRVLKDRDKFIINKLSDVSTTNDEYIIDENTPALHKPINLQMELCQMPITIAKGREHLYVDAELIQYPLVLRKWKAGDWFIPFGMKGKKKLSDYFSDQKFSIKDKEDAWILTSNDKIVWLVGHRSDDRFRVGKTTKSVLHISISQ